MADQAEDIISESKNGAEGLRAAATLSPMNDQSMKGGRVSFQKPDEKDTDSSTRDNSDDMSRGRRSDIFSHTQRSLRKLGGFLSETKLTSLQLRKLPVNALLRPHSHDVGSVVGEDLFRDDRSERFSHDAKDLLHWLCLRPNYTIKKQLMLAFGTINAVSTLCVVLVCVVTAVLAGASIKDTNRDSFENLERASQFRTAEYVARSLSQRLIASDEVNTIRELAMDRFSGYPDPSDASVPFIDMDTNERIYPITAPQLPLDWQLTPNVNEENYEEHFQTREFWKSHLETVSTLNGAFMMQGSCDPAITNRDDPKYWPICNDANNDLSVGGVVAPAETTEFIHRKSSDLVPAMKVLFESREEIRDIGILFSNDGAGASVLYPQFIVNGTATYRSEGCEWMLEPNPLKPSESIAKASAISKCRSAGEAVSMRSFNPMETSWCAKQALRPDDLIVETVADELDSSKSWLLRFGRAIYDRITMNFIGCSYVGVSLLQVEWKLKESRFTGGSEVSLVAFGKMGTIVASSVSGLASENTAIANANLGLSSAAYEELYSLVDYDSKWNSTEISRAYGNFQARDEQFLVSAYPIPPIPDEYDAKYRPIVFVVSSTSIEEIFEVVNDTNNDVDEAIRQLILLSIFVGAIGIALTTIIIFSMASVLTLPLKSMNDAANDIVKSFGDPSKDSQLDNSSLEKRQRIKCCLRTELDDVVVEFNKMVSSFSGRMMATSQKGRYPEVSNNDQSLRESLASLYQSRLGFKYDLSSTSEGIKVSGESGFLYSGSNLLVPQDDSTSVDREPARLKRGCSPLLSWILGFIVTPLLLSNITITVIVLRTISQEFSESIDRAKVDFLAVQRRTLAVHSSLRADSVSSLVSRPTRDAYFISRYASWLLFGGLEKSAIFPKVTSGIEECKAINNWFEECEYSKTFVCDCEWDNSGYISNGGCSDYPGGSRDLQLPYWSCESRPVAENGDRTSSLFPNASFSPESTEWWDDPSTLPGFDEGYNSSGYESTYSRLRSVAALPILQQFYKPTSEPKGFVTSFVAFEADGLVFGYDACNSFSHVEYSRYRARKGDAAARPELCPEGKYGYDPRCRGWYDVGRKLATQNQTFLFVTAPYSFATGTLFFAQSATIPLIDPKTDDHVGQVLVDFLADPLITELEEYTYLSDSGFPFVIVTQSGTERNTVLAPGFQQNEAATPIAQQVLPFDFECQTDRCIKNIDAFEMVVGAMRRGESGVFDFRRTGPDSQSEVVHMAFSPVKVKSFRPIDSSVFSRGVDVSDYLVYALALAEPESAILKPFDPIESTTERQTRIAFSVLCILIATATLVVAVTSNKVARSITDPLLYVSDLIHSINSNDSKQSSGSDVGRVNSSREVSILSETMEMLYTCLRSANEAFYAGDLQLAHHILIDSLRLFRRLGNKKAIGIASNNLGNVVLAMYLAMRTEKVVRLGPLSRLAAVKNGISYFGEAIRLGEAAYDEFYNLHGWTPICLGFMQHLANRYFNRGLFLLTVKGDHKDPGELEQLGRRDLKIAQDMDQEILSYSEEIGWASADRIVKTFENKVLRVRGYNLLMQQGYDDDWEIETLLDEAFDILKDEAKKDSSKLFSTMTLQGRMQDLEAELIKYKLHNEENTAAAQIAIRMLLEDEFTFIDARAQALEALLKYVKYSLDAGQMDTKRIMQTLEDMRLELEEASEDQSSLQFTETNSSVLARTSFMSGASKNSFTQGSMRMSLSDDGFNNSFSLGGVKKPATGWFMKQNGGRFVIMEDF